LEYTRIALRVNVRGKAGQVSFGGDTFGNSR